MRLLRGEDVPERDEKAVMICSRDVRPKSRTSDWYVERRERSVRELSVEWNRFRSEIVL